MLFYPVLKGQALQAYRASVDKIVSIAKTQSHLRDDDIVVRPLRPQDLGQSTQYWSLAGATSAGWNDVINTTVSNDRYIAIYGVASNESIANLTQIRMQREQSYARYYSTEMLAGFESKIGYVTDPITISEKTNITIGIYQTTAATITKTSFIGAVAEKRGILLNPINYAV